jgi:NAD(P)-dependent dehydrogenase (short-subunit alcohol dehydrogenase family)
LAELGESASATVLLDLEMPQIWGPAIEALPPLDGIVFSSGSLDVCPFRVLKPENFSTALTVNVVSPVALLRALARSGKLKAGSSIVFIGSIAGIRGAVGHLSYSACKSALHGVVRTLALELAPQRIRVNLVSPGLVLAGMGTAIGTSVTEEQIQEYAKKYPLGLGRPSDVAGPVAFLLSSAAGWITGQDIVTDGGATLS